MFKNNISSIFRFWSDLTKIKFTDNDTFPHIPGGIFFIHSVKSPLTSLKINLAQLELELEKTANVKASELVSRIKFATNQINLLVDSIPNINKVPENTKINVREVLQGLKILYSRENSSYELLFNIKLRSGDEHLEINRLHFFELMTCLIRNSFESYDLKSKNKVVIVTVVEQNNQLEIQVQDFGKGVTIFQQMMMTKNGYSTKSYGQGFGMWFVKEIVENHFKRKLKIISEVGKGTIVRFSLPVV